MDDDDRRVLDLLHALDRLPGPEHLEFPDGFDLNRARMRAIQLRKRLNDEFGDGRHETPCRLDDRIQDASYYFGVRIPPRATEADEWICLRLSNYGDLVVITTPRPESHPDLDAAVAAGALSVRDRERVETVLSEMEYQLVPLPLLQRGYDGVTWLAEAETGDGSPVTWWTRFFEYL
ncbi:hypothetical protein ACFV83_28975 [Streptomyces pharetrae]|jgi:hypothetical protein|uniref:hypothetical protein n=1 Tax=Streptomyces pharetrae TaxID=291370 RepID=UPI0034605501